MSKTKFIEFGQCGFWAYDVALGVFLKYLIDVAETSTEASSPWLSNAVEEWRVQACVDDYGVRLDSNWSTQQRQTFIALAEQACTILSQRASISAEEIKLWRLIDGVVMPTRDATDISTAPIVELGRAMIALVSGELQQAPTGTLWLYGTERGRETLNMNRVR